MSNPERPENVTLELLKKYNKAGPRYTSYPTAVEFHDRFGFKQYEAALAEADRASDEPFSLYIHIPFCEERCTFCGCHVVIAKKPDVSRRYLDYLKREIDLLAERLPHRRKVVQYHWGGGTPTYISVDEMQELHRAVTSRFEIVPGAEVAIEVDPRTTTTGQIDLLKSSGFNRVSMGVQDFDPQVQRIINRNQDEKSTVALYDYCRKAGIDSINLDLIYGLPRQTAAGFENTLKRVIHMRPDRVAVYSFAFVPWIRGNQKGFDEKDLPSAELKLELFQIALTTFMDAGYEQIGMDHFALPEDELSVSMRERKLHRNFMGYTTRPASDMLGLGVSAIGDVQGAFVQSEKKLSRYYEAIDDGHFPVYRGFELSDDDKIRRHVITRLMCNFHLDRADTESRFGIDFADYFAAELEDLKEPAEHGFIEVGDNSLDVTATGRLFIRNVCMIFDKYLRDKDSDDRPVFSKTI